MNIRRSCAHGLALFGMLLALVVSPFAGAATAVLESSALRVEVTAAPYSYSIIDSSTGNVLVKQSQTTFTLGSGLIATQASIVDQTATTLDATLILSGTSDTAHVRWTLLTPDIVQVALSYNNGTPTNIKEQFEDRGEHYYGIWGYASTATGVNVDVRGADRDLLGITNGNAGTANGNTRAPFYVTSARYGVYAESEAKGHYTVAVNGQTSFNFDTPSLTYDVIHGASYADILRNYRALTSPPRMPPLWAFNPVWWRDDHHADLAPNGVTNAQALVKSDADNLQLNHLPASSMWLDRPYGNCGGGLGGWGNFDFDSGATGFPNPDAMIADLEARNMHLMLWIANRANCNMLTDPLFAPYIFNAANGYTGNFTSTPAIDLRQSAAFAHFSNLLNLFVSRGIRGYKIDRGEEGELPAALQNQMTVLDGKLAAEDLQRAYGDDFFIFARNMYDRNRQYVAGTWTGDTQTNLNGLIASVKMAQRNGPILFPMTGSDTGGYTGGAPNKETFARWLGFSAHTSMMEILLGPNRTIWNNSDNNNGNATAPQLVDIARKFTQEHHDMIPYTRSMVYNATQTGWPVMRMLTFAYPNDPSLADTWDEYMYGDALLVAPVTTAGATSRSIYLPAGGWTDYNDKTTHYAGPTTFTAAAPLDVIPRYVKAGSIIPRGDILQGNDNWTPNWAPSLDIEFFPAAGITSGFNYYTGTAIVQMFGYISNNTVFFKFNNLGANGNVEMYNIPAFSTVVRNGTVLVKGTDFQYDPALQRLTIPFTGPCALQVTLASG